MTPHHATRAVIYTRISRDPTSRRLGVDRQEEACRAVAEQLGWHVVRVFEDNDTSAGKEKDPPQYTAMIAACEAGEADAIIVAKVDRLHRQLWKFAPFMKWRKENGIRFATTEGDNTETESGRTILGIKAVLAQGEWERIQERVKAAVRQRAERGQHNGGKLPYYVENPEAAQWVRDAADQVLAGTSLHAIAREWNKQGRLTAEGNQWLPRAIRRMLLSPSVIGKRELDGELYEVPWEAVLDHTTWDNVRAILTAPDRRINEVNQRKYMLSGLLNCALCGNNLTSTGPRTTVRRGAQRSDGPAFECSKHKTSAGGCGKVKISMDPLERFIAEQVFFVLDTPEFHAAVAQGQQTTTDDAATLRTQIANDEAALRALSDEKDDGLITDAEYRRRRARITQRLDEATARLQAIKPTKASLPTADELRAVWSDADPAWQRQIVSAVIERIDVGPHPRGVSSAPPRRSGEPLETWRARFDAARMATMAQRVSITWAA